MGAAQLLVVRMNSVLLIPQTMRVLAALRVHICKRRGPDTTFSIRELPSLFPNTDIQSTLKSPVGMLSCNDTGEPLARYCCSIGRSEGDIACVGDWSGMCRGCWLFSWLMFLAGQALYIFGVLVVKSRRVGAGDTQEELIR